MKLKVTWQMQTVDSQYYDTSIALLVLIMSEVL